MKKLLIYILLCSNFILVCSDDILVGSISHPGVVFKIDPTTPKSSRRYFDLNIQIFNRITTNHSVRNLAIELLLARELTNPDPQICVTLKGIINEIYHNNLEIENPECIYEWYFHAIKSRPPIFYKVYETLIDMLLDSSDKMFNALQKNRNEQLTQEDKDLFKNEIYPEIRKFISDTKQKLRTDAEKIGFFKTPKLDASRQKIRETQSIAYNLATIQSARQNKYSLFK